MHEVYSQSRYMTNRTWADGSNLKYNISQIGTDNFQWFFSNSKDIEQVDVLQKDRIAYKKTCIILLGEMAILYFLPVFHILQILWWKCGLLTYSFWGKCNIVVWIVISLQPLPCSKSRIYFKHLTICYNERLF